MIYPKFLLIGSLALLIALGIPSSDSRYSPSHPNGVNLPQDFSPIKNNVYLYPPRENRPLKNASLVITQNSCPYTPQDSKNVLNAIDRIVNTFYKENYQQIFMRNDAGVGLVVLRGQISYILAEREDKLSPTLKEYLGQLHDLSGQLARHLTDQAINAETDPSIKYGTQIMKNRTNVLQARSRSWLNEKTITKHFPEFTKIGNENEVLYPYLDFHCLVSLINDCSVPHVCQKMYLTDIYSQYMLMNQVIYQQFAERRSCVASNEEAFGNAQEFRDRLCSKAYLEALFLEKNDFPTRYVDLFAEQVGVCGLMGYSNFMRADWVSEILSWQEGSKSGCFNDLYGELKTTDSIIIVDIKGEEKTQESCLVHLTSVSLMALSLNLRYMMDTCSPNIFDGYFN